MAEDRRDHDIEVFALDDGDVPPDGPVSTGPGAPGRPEHASAADGDQAEDAAAVDAIRQGPEAGARMIPPRVPLGRGRSVTPGALAAAVAGLVVVAFLAGLLTGRATGPRHSSPVARSAVVVSYSGEFGSVLPPQPSLTRRARLVLAPSGTAGPTGNVSPSAVYALQLATRPASRTGQSLERRDRGALNGPWSLIVRRDDGSLGRHGAVVTYPLARTDLSPLPKKRIPVGTTTGYLDVDGAVIWAIGGKFARIRGDLGASTLAGIAARVSAQRERPTLVQPPPRFRVVAFEPYRAPVVAESRYTNSLLLDSGPIDGLIFTDVLRGASFEEELYVEGSSPAGVIGGHPAVTTPVGGGNAALAWEPVPGTVVYVGYSGGLAASASTAALVDLTRAGKVLDRPQWLATHPSVVDNINVYP